MKLRIILICFALYPLAVVAQTFRLAPPNVGQSRMFYKKGLTIPLDFRQEGASIHYTLNGAEPDRNAAQYTRPVRIKRPCTLRCTSFHPDFAPSETVDIHILPAPVFPDSLTLSAPPAPAYSANGQKTVYDGILGTPDFHHNWLGFQADSLRCTLYWKKNQRLSQISLGLLQMQGAWIFLPERILILDASGKKLGERSFPGSDAPQNDRIEWVTIPVRPGQYRQLHVVIMAQKALPDWHAGKGSKTWWFIDEISGK